MQLRIRISDSFVPSVHRVLRGVQSIVFETVTMPCRWHRTASHQASEFILVRLRSRLHRRVARLSTWMTSRYDIILSFGNVVGLIVGHSKLQSSATANGRGPIITLIGMTRVVPQTDVINLRQRDALYALLVNSRCRIDQQRHPAKDINTSAS